MKKSTSLTAAVFLALLALGACTKEKKETTTTTTTTTTEVKPAEVAPAAGVTGVPECDDYISKYEKCLNDKVPEVARGALKDALDKSRETWKSAAGYEATKSTLPATCKQAMDATKTAMSAYGCEW